MLKPCEQSFFEGKGLLVTGEHEAGSVFPFVFYTEQEYQDLAQLNRQCLCLKQELAEVQAELAHRFKAG